jgi:drug/metabolite transporter (DMT)-like permease
MIRSMSATVFLAILFAAALHALWNAIVKGASDTLLTTALVGLSAAIVSAVALPFLVQPAPASWPFLAVSAVLQTTYYFLIAATYRAADMSLAYPLMRGSAPLIVAVASATWVGETLSAAAWAGIALISLGVGGMALAGRGRSDPRGIALALANAVVIAAYTITDGLGARQSGSPASYAMWLSVLTAIPLLGFVMATRAGAFRRYLAGNVGLGFVGGVATLTAYGLALWAMTLAPVAVVAALRETSILFAAAIAVFVLKEKATPVRLAAAGVIALGAVVLRLA